MIFSKGWRAVTDINCYIINAAAYCTHKYTLWVLGLKVKSPEYAFSRSALIILNKFHRKAGIKKVSLAVNFKKVTAGIAKDHGLDFVKSLYFSAV